MALKEFNGSMLPSAPSSTLTVTSSVPLRCGSFSCNMVRILVLPSGSVSLLILATDFDLEIVENDCFKNSVLPEAPWRSLVWPLCCPWRSALSPWRLPEWSWKEADSMLCAHFGHLVTSWPGLLMFAFALMSLWMCYGTVCLILLNCLDLHCILKWFLFPHLWHFLPQAGHSLGGWDVPHLPQILPLLLVRALARDPWPFSCEGSDLVDCGRCCNSSVGLVSVKVLDGCFVLFCMLQ